MRRFTNCAISVGMKLTLIQPTDVPGPLRDRFGAYYLMIERMLAGQDFTFETIQLSAGHGGEQLGGGIAVQHDALD